MNNETLKRDLCARLPYGVKLKHSEITFRLVQIDIDEDLAFGQSYLSMDDGYYPYYMKSIKPILFSTSALTKEIQIASYNNGEPFVPIYELARLFHTISPDCIEDYTDAVEHGFYGAQCTCWLSVKEGRCNYFQMPFGDFITSAEFRVIEKLNQWHINYRLSPEQFIEVTDEFNPYK